MNILKFVSSIRFVKDKDTKIRISYLLQGKDQLRQAKEPSFLFEAKEPFVAFVITQILMQISAQGKQLFQNNISEFRT